MINTDTFLKMGDQHKICEDYVISGVTKQGDPPLQYIILSDGCSKSEKTEMGARILCYMAQQFIRYNFHSYPFLPDYKKMGLWIIHNAEMTARSLGLNRDCLDATLIISWVDSEHSTANIFIYGDGFVILKGKDGLQLFGVDFRPDNAPYYLSYELDPERKQLYHELKVSKILTTNTSRGAIASGFIEEQYAYDAGIIKRLDMDEYDSIIIASDGLGSFYSDNGPMEAVKPVDTFKWIVPEFINFKGKKNIGSYLQRRVSKEIKLLIKEDIFHFDDLSLGSYAREEPKYGYIHSKQHDGRSKISSKVS